MVKVIDAASAAHDTLAVREEKIDVSTKFGRMVLHVYAPSAFTQQRYGAPDILVPYSQGWAEDEAMVRAASSSLADGGNFMVAGVTYPDHRIAMSVRDEPNYRREAFMTALEAILREKGDDWTTVLHGYSRGNEAIIDAALAASQYVHGLSFAGPAWLTPGERPHTMMGKGLREGIYSLRREDIPGKIGLAQAALGLGYSLVTRPLALRNDVAAITDTDPSLVASKLQRVVAQGIPLSVMIGTEDNICPEPGIRAVIDHVGVPDTMPPIDVKRTDVTHFGYYSHAWSLAAIVRQIEQLASYTRNRPL
ncbi:MAG TPA: hypothetical protein PKV96_03190 [Candidatus Saccharimonas sp.]|nr:hypothetical protein [Candidatus Saccharimonas sp.]